MQSYLKMMGIDTWTLRQNNLNALPPCYAYELLSEGRSIGLLLAEATVADEVTATLLQKMVLALKCDWRGQWHSMQPDCSELEGLRFVVALGDRFELDAFDVPVIKSYAPQRLIAEPKLKTETWKSLQAVFSYF